MRFLLSLFFLSLLLNISARSQEQAVTEASRSRAQEVLKQAREALGGQANLDAVKGLQLQGDFKGVRFNRPTQGDIKIEMLLPDKYMRTARAQMGPMEMTMIQTVNGADAWFDMKTSSIAMGGGGMGDASGGMGGGGGMGGRGIEAQ